MIELGHEHLVAGAQRAGESAREEEVEAGHARPEHDLLAIATQECARTFPRVSDERVGPPRCLERTADVGVRLAEVGGDRIDDLVGAMRAARAVEEGERPLQRREPCADRGDVEFERCAHSDRA